MGLTESEADDALRAVGYDTRAGRAHGLACRRLALDGDRSLLDAYFAAADVDPYGCVANGYTRRDVARGQVLAKNINRSSCQQGRPHLEVAPAHLSDRKTAEALGAVFRLDPRGLDIDDQLAHRRYTMTGDYRAVEEWEAEQFADV